MIEVYINNNRIDLPLNTSITQTFQRSDVGDLSKRKTSFTTKFKVPKTPNNVKTFTYLGLVGKINKPYDSILNPNEFPFGKPTARLTESSIDLIKNGFAQVFEDNDDYYDLSIYGEERTFFEKIKDLTIQDTFPASFNVNLKGTGVNSISSFYDTNDDFIFCTCQNSDYVRSVYTIDGANITNPPNYTWYNPTQMTPQFYVKDLFKYIFSYLGYTIQYPLLNNGFTLDNDPTFKNMLMSAKRTVSSFNLTWGSNIQIKQLVHDMPCDDFIKEIVMRWNLNLIVDEQNKIVTLKSQDVFLKNGDVIDWSNKYSETKNRKYTIGNYGQANKMTYEDDTKNYVEYLNQPAYFRITNADELIGSFEIKNINLKNSYNVFESKIKKPIYTKVLEGQISTTQTLTGLLILVRSLTNFETYHLIDMKECEYAKDNSGNNNYDVIDSVVDEFEPLFFIRKRMQVIPDRLGADRVMRFKSPTGYDSLSTPFVNILQYEDRYVTRTTYGTNGTVINNDVMSFQLFLNNHYKYTIQVLQDVAIYKCMILLSTIDIYNFDFFKKIYIKQLGQYFYVNKINNYKQGKVTEVELVKIPSLT